MKASKNARFNDEFAGEVTKRSTKLVPNKKSGKERHHLYQSLEQDDDEDFDLYDMEVRESVRDYIDDEDFEDDFEEDEDED